MFAGETTGGSPGRTEQNSDPVLSKPDPVASEPGQ
jgi:hypothetical protein